jgi:DNA-binding LytR/AlgR family response regulator
VHGDVEVTGEAANAQAAAELAPRCDVLFLDIEMAGGSGLDAARLLRDAPTPPAVVFVTAHAEYAVDAFAVEAFDYLVKPVDPERLARVLERLRDRRPAAREPKKIPVVAGGRTELIGHEQVHYVQAEGDYTRIHVYDRSYLSTASLRELEGALPAELFVRIHRSFLVNLAHVASVRRTGADRLKLALDDARNTELDVARRQAPRVRAALKLG